MGSITIPEVTQYPSHVTAGEKVAVSMGPEFVDAIMASNERVAAWLRANGINEFGPTYIKYDVIDMQGIMQLEFGWFVHAPIPPEIVAEVAASGGDIVITDTLAGEYATATYTGNYDNLFTATAMFLGWAKERGLEWDAWDTPEGHAFAARYEIYKVDPGDEPDPEKWVTELAFKVKG